MPMSEPQPEKGRIASTRSLAEGKIGWDAQEVL